MSYHHGNLRRALIDRAAEIIAAQGVEKLSLRALARDLGVSHAAPARHFKDKQALLAAVAGDTVRDLIAALDAAADAAGDDPVARYNAIGKAVVRFALERPAHYAALNHPDVRMSADEDLTRILEAYMERLHLAAAAAQEKGWLPGRSTRAAVYFSTAAAEGIAAILSAPTRCRDMAMAERPAFGEEIIDMVIPPTSASLEAAPAAPQDPPAPEGPPEHAHGSEMPPAKERNP